MYLYMQSTLILLCYSIEVCNMDASTALHDHYVKTS